MKPFLILLVIVSLFFLFPEAGIAVRHLPAPTIGVNPDIYYPFDEILYLEGRARPNTNVEVNFRKDGAKPLKFIVRGDINGEWVFAQKVPLNAGNWEVRVRIIESSGLGSAFSNPRIIRVIATGVSIGGAAIKFSFLIFLLIIILILSGAAILYFFLRVKKVTREKEREAAEVLIEQNFAELRRNILDELEHLTERAGQGPLSSKEEDHRQHLLRGLREAEQSIEKKLRDIL
ncbi:hypothetical protein IIA95_00470 [Patescibacteria group bacterium]|nr:hypothetical protein [Patescibacteria group bacterium]